MAPRNSLAEVEKELREVASILVELGMAEASGGNLSVKLNLDEFPKPTRELEIPYYEGPEMTLLITPSGSRMRDLSRGRGNFLLIKAKKGKLLVHGRGKPTSELPTHLLCHSSMEHEALIHAHPKEVIALSIIDPEKIPKLVEILPEMRYYFPRGIDVIEGDPGSIDLARRTSEKVGKYCVVWRGHGAVTSGKDVWEALDRMELIEKASYLMRITGDFKGQPL